MLLADREDFVRDLRSEAIQRDGECDIIIALASFCETPQSTDGLTDGLSASKIHGKELSWRPHRPHERSHPRDGHSLCCSLVVCFPRIISKYWIECCYIVTNHVCLYCSH
jgi:hypothetical protein